MSDDGSDRRQHSRTPIALMLRVKYEQVDEFVERYATNISSGGIFLQSRKLYPEGSLLQFEIQLRGGQTVLRGKGQVAWVRQPAEPGAKPQVPGMGVKFIEIDEGSRDVVARMLKLRGLEGAAPVPVAKPRKPKSGRPRKRVSSQPLPPPPDPVAVAPGPAEPSIQVDESMGAEQIDASLTDALHVDVDLDAAGEEAGDSTPPPLPKGSGASRIVIGIDLGTTNSCAAVVLEGRPQVIPSRKGYRTIPSIVAIDEKGKLRVGHEAKAQMALNPVNTIYGSKRLIGRPFHSPVVQQVRDRFHYEIVEGPGGAAAVSIADRSFSLQQVSGLVLAEIRTIARDMLKEDVQRAVITVPAYYNDNQRQAVRQAGALAGLNVERIVNEPTAAALAFGFNRSLDQRVLVFDLGGGTFDASVLELTENVYEVVATGGDTFLGGVDFDNQLVDHLFQEFCANLGRVPEVDRAAMQRLRDAAEQAKCALSEKEQTIVRLPFFVAVDNTPKDLEVRVTRAQLETLVSPLVERAIDVSLLVLSQANLKPPQIDNVLMVGGQSRMPMIRQRIAEVFGREPHKGVHPDEAVAVGAALLADSLDKIDAVVLIDVLPMSIGIGLPGGGFQALLMAGTPLPASRSHVISTFHDRQAQIGLLLFQGESPRVLGNEYLGTLVVDGIPPAPKGGVQVEIQFSLNQECLLKATARVLGGDLALETRMTRGENESSIRNKLHIPGDELPQTTVGFPTDASGRSLPLNPPPPSARPPSSPPVAPSAPPPADLPAQPPTPATEEVEAAPREGLLSRLFGRGKRKK